MTRPARQDADVTMNLLRSLYDSRAQIYEDLWAPILEIAGVQLLEGLQARRNGEDVEAALDMGTGVGTLLPHLARRFPRAEITGIDVSAGMLALASPAHTRAIMDARRLDFPGESMDLAVASFMLFYLIPPLAGVREARRVLREGGLFGCTTWGSKVPESEADRVWRECLDAQGASTPPPAIPSSGGDLDTPDKLYTLLLAGGFDDIVTWEETLEFPFDRDTLLRLRRHMGSEIGRFRSLDPRRQAACLEEAHRRMASLPPEAFTLRARVVYALGAAR